MADIPVSVYIDNEVIHCAFESLFGQPTEKRNELDKSISNCILEKQTISLDEEKLDALARDCKSITVNYIEPQCTEDDWEECATDETCEITPGDEGNICELEVAGNSCKTVGKFSIKNGYCGQMSRQELIEFEVGKVMRNFRKNFDELIIAEMQMNIATLDPATTIGSGGSITPTEIVFPESAYSDPKFLADLCNYAEKYFVDNPWCLIDAGGCLAVGKKVNDSSSAACCTYNQLYNIFDSYLSLDSAKSNLCQQF